MMRSQTTRDTFKKILYDNWIIVIPVIYILTGLYFKWELGFNHFKELRFTGHWFNPFAVYFILFYFAIVLTGKFYIFLKGKECLYDLLKDVKHDYLTIKCILGFALVYFLIPPFFSTFSSFKMAIPIFNDYHWDEVFMNTDRILHFGYHPWQILHPVLGIPSITRLLDLLYSLWFYLLFAVTIWMAFSKDRRLRMQYFTSFFVVWIFLGTILATAFSSVGPCYYDKIVSKDNPFNELLAYLNTVNYGNASPLFATANQNMLWESFVSGNMLEFGGGISAMPSLHVAMVVLFCLVGWRTHCSLGLIFSVYAIFVFLGSIHLGWHYAIDGYLSIILTLMIWYAFDYVAEIKLFVIRRTRLGFVFGEGRPAPTFYEQPLSERSVENCIPPEKGTQTQNSL